MDQDAIQAFRDKQKAEADKQAQLNAVTGSGDKVTKEVADSINKLNVTTFMSSNGYSDMANNVEALSTELQKLEDSFREQGLFTISDTFNSLIQKLEEVSDTLTGSKFTVDEGFINSLDALKQSIDRVDFNPTVNVKAGEPKVVTTPVNFDPVVKAIEAQNVKGINLDDYKAQDLLGDDAFQYIGFVAPNGGWYIIENDINGSSLRYKFGKKGYKTNWKNHVNHSYKLLNEAINEIQA